jgi:hypothetical protein
MRDQYITGLFFQLVFSFSNRNPFVLDCKKARGCAVKAWPLVSQKFQTGGMVSSLSASLRAYDPASRPITG